MIADKALYLRILDNRPVKFNAEEAQYRKSTGKEKCGGCAHFYTRNNDGHTVCEIFRPEGEDENVKANYVCQFWNDDSEHFPLLEE